MWKVIVADDEPFIREALKEMIPWDELGYHLAEALKNGKEVVNAVEKYKPDIVILDIQMPLMTGMEAAQWIHENYPDIVVVLLTAYEDFKYAQQAIVFQVKRYVIKSNLFEDLPKALEEISEELKKDNRSEKNRTEVYAGQKNKLNDNKLNKIVCNIISCMQSGDENVCMEEMQKLRSAIRDYSDSYIRSAAILFISECHRLYIEYGDDEVTGFDMEQEDAINLILETKRIIEIEDCLESMMLSFVRKKNKKIQIILLAGIQGISRSYYEAASMDGASGIRQFFSITLPLITPTLFFVLVTTLISTFQTFDTIYMMIQKTGLAMEASQSMVVYFYKNAFEFSKKGYASALAVFLFLIIMLITALQMKLQKKWVNYE